MTADRNQRTDTEMNAAFARRLAAHNAAGPVDMLRQRQLRACRQVLDDPNSPFHLDLVSIADCQIRLDAYDDRSGT